MQDYLAHRPSTGRPEDWREIAPVPRASERFRPQGLVFDDGVLWLTDHHRNTRSHLYRIDPGTGEVLFDAPLPAGMLHSGGLALHEDRLWAVDYVSTMLYAIDPVATLETGRVQVEARYGTGLTAASGLGALEVDGIVYLAISDFLWRMQTTPPRPDGTAQTYLLPASTLAQLDEAGVPELATIAYPNGGFSQGLVWDGEVLFEACNNVGIDRVEILDVRDAIRGRDASLIRRRGSFAGPGPMIEDLATDGERLWTTDEGTFKLYEHPDPPRRAHPSA